MATLREQLAALDKAIEGAIKNPGIVNVPSVQVTGSEAGSFEGAAAILGSSNLIQALKGVSTQPAIQ